MSISRKIIALLMCLFLAGTFAVADGAETGEPAKAGGELFVTYVYAGQRASIWTDYLTAVATASKAAEVRSQFGLVTAEELQTWSDSKQQARDQLKLKQQEKEAVYSSLSSGYAWTGSAAPLVPLSQLQADPKLLAALRQALQDEKKAKSEAESAAWMLRSGMIDAMQAVAKHEAYKNARLLTTDAKVAYLQSLLASYTAASGSPLSVTSLLSLLQQGAVAELRGEWTSAIIPFTKPLLSKATDGTIVRNEEAYVSLRSYAVGLGYKVSSDKATGRIQLTGESDLLVIDPKKKLLIKNEQESPLLAQPFIHNNTTYVPLSFFSEAFGIEAIWREADQQVLKISPIIGKDGSS